MYPGMTQMQARGGWQPLSVGCHWTKGDYTISTTQQGTRTGYALYYRGLRLAEYCTWDEAVAQSGQ